MTKDELNRNAFTACVMAIANDDDLINKDISDRDIAYAIVKACNGLHSSDFKELNSRMFDGIHYILIEHLPEFKDLLRNDDIEMLLTEGY